jgi:HD-like signal output (HDOD) protein
VAPSDGAPSQAVRARGLEFLAKLAHEVSSGTVDLPCFPDIVLRIRNELADPKTTPERVVLLVRAEPRLAARLLQTANSAAFNQSGKPVADLRLAITRLGHQLVQSVAMSYAVRQMTGEPFLQPVAQQLKQLWKESVTVASMCQALARRTSVCPDTAFLAGLLHGIGGLYIRVHAVAKSTEPDYDAFLELISDWHASIGKAVLENWGFAPEICEAIGDQELVDRDRRRRHEADLTDILIAGVMLGKALQTPAAREAAIRSVAAHTPLALSAQDYVTVWGQAGRHLASLQETLGC